MARRVAVIKFKSSVDEKVGKYIMDDFDKDWHQPDAIECRCLTNYFTRNNKIPNIFFRIWIGFGIIGMIGSVYGVFQSIHDEPGNTVLWIFCGIVGCLAIYLFFIKFGRYVVNVALQRELTALKNKKLLLCVSIVTNKDARISHSGGNGRQVKHNYYVFADYSDGDNIVNNAIRLPHNQYADVSIGDKIVLISYGDGIQSEYMQAFSISHFLAYFDEG